MTRFTLLASVALTAAAPAFAQSNSEPDTGTEGDAMAETAGNDGSGANDMLPDTEAGDFVSQMMGQGQIDSMIRASNVVGGDVYVTGTNGGWSDAEWADLDFAEQTDATWTEVGTVTDVVFRPDGQRAGLIVSHGGFLDFGDKTVLLNMADVRRIGPLDALDGDYNYVTRLSVDDIRIMEQVPENWF